jgi:hypothetical protein
VNDFSRYLFCKYLTTTLAASVSSLLFPNFGSSNKNQTDITAASEAAPQNHPYDMGRHAHGGSRALVILETLSAVSRGKVLFPYFFLTH